PDRLGRPGARAHLRGRGRRWRLRRDRRADRSSGHLGWPGTSGGRSGCGGIVRGADRRRCSGRCGVRRRARRSGRLVPGSRARREGRAAMIGRGRTVAMLLAGMIGVLPVTAPVAAAPAESQYAPTMIVLDASGSMLRPDPSGTMMDAAKNAVRSFVESAPERSRVGLAAYGTGTSNDEAEKGSGCADVKILHQPEQLDRGALLTAVDGIQASGWTP